MWVWYDQNMSMDMIFMDITDIDLFDQIVGAKVKLRCSWISLVLIYLIKMWYGMCQG